MEKIDKTKILQNISRDRETLSRVSLRICDYVKNNNLFKDSEPFKYAEEVFEIYNKLPEAESWQEYSSLISKYEKILIKFNKLEEGING